MSLNTTRPFTRAEALAAGLTDVELRSRRFQRLFHGLYIRTGSKIGVHAMAAAALHICPPGSFASHETAAALWGAAVSDLNEVHVSVPKGSSRSERRGIVAHRATTDQNPRLHRGLLVSEPTRVFLELAAARTDLVDLVAVGDSLVRRKRTTPEELVVAAGGYTGKGSRLARRAASYVRSGVDSPTESRLRMLIVLGGLPEPQVNHILRERNGEWSSRLDLCYSALKLVVEYDGRHHAEVRANWLSDIKRRETLERDGWRFVIVTSEGLYEAPSIPCNAYGSHLLSAVGTSSLVRFRPNCTGSSPIARSQPDSPSRKPHTRSENRPLTPRSAIEYIAMVGNLTN
jgi:hypothetical protein